jgi:hypothetical protein
MTTSQYLLNIHTRQTLHESFYVEHQHSTVRLLIACLEDFDVLRRYVKEQWFVFYSVLGLKTRLKTIGLYYTN